VYPDERKDEYMASGAYRRCKLILRQLVIHEVGTLQKGDYRGTLYEGSKPDGTVVLYLFDVQELAAANFFIVPGRTNMLHVFSSPQVHGLEGVVLGGSEDDLELFLRQHDV
jgi:hypothetical protein